MSHRSPDAVTPAARSNEGGDAYARWLDHLHAGRSIPRAFVVGCAKSGTTWLMKLLDAHADAVFRGEGRFAWALGPTLFKALEAFNASQRETGQPTATHIGEPEAWCALRAVIDARMLAWADEWSAQTGRPVSELRVLGDKTPQHAVGLATLNRLFPGSRCIHIVRHPLDAATSAWHHFGAHDPRPMDEYLAYFVGTVWPTNVGAAAASAAELGDRLLTVRYEDLHADVRAQTRRCLQHLGLSVTDDDIERCAQAASFRTLSGGRARGEGDDGAFFRKGVVGDWATLMPTQRARELCAPIETLMQRFGYTPPSEGQTGVAQTASMGVAQRSESPA